MHEPARRPQLAQGVRVVRRGPHHLQIGLYEGHRAVLPRSESVQRALVTLLERRPVGDDPRELAVLATLDQHGLLRWESRQTQDPAIQARPTVARPTVAVLGRMDVPGVPGPRALLEAAGLSLAPATGRVDVAVVLSMGEVDRVRLDPLIRAGTSHVVVRLVDGGAVLGPFVAPGTTACLRCIDAHMSVRDPDHVAVTARYVRATVHPRPDGIADVDPALAWLALGWAVRDVAAHLDGREPSTWSRTLLFSADPARRTEHSWLRHPRCGCCWQADNRLSGTM